LAGCGLLLLRLVVGSVLLVDAGSKLWSDPPLQTTLAMSGPGRWSADAQFFGWKRIEAPPRRSRLPQRPL
jgi:hypothetical protein